MLIAQNTQKTLISQIRWPYKSLENIVKTKLLTETEMRPKVLHILGGADAAGPHLNTRVMQQVASEHHLPRLSVELMSSCERFQVNTDKATLTFTS